MGAFIFAAQMINFTIPVTGSSGHLGGGMILAILLGPHAAFLTMASILLVQALFFGDGGLLALGCNIFNLGFFPCFIAYPLIYKKMVGQSITQVRILIGSLIASVIGLQMGAFGVVLETLFSGVTELSFSTFVLFMQPIHLAIGIAEGFATAAVVGFIWKTRPEILRASPHFVPMGNVPVRRVLIGMSVMALIIGGGLSWFASAHPDGLEWAISRAAGTEKIQGSETGVHESLASVQEKTAILPDYGFKREEEEVDGQESWPTIDTGTTISGFVGSALTLFLAGLIGFMLKRQRSKSDIGAT